MDTNQQNAWLRRQLDAAVSQCGQCGAFHSALIEVKPAWAAPGHFLIGQAREQGEPREFRWFIIGDDGFFDQVPGNTAVTPRDAARHFSMKWQLDATRREGKKADELVERAEVVYTLTEEDRLWESG